MRADRAVGLGFVLLFGCASTTDAAPPRSTPRSAPTPAACIDANQRIAPVETLVDQGKLMRASEALDKAVSLAPDCAGAAAPLRKRIDEGLGENEKPSIALAERALSAAKSAEGAARQRLLDRAWSLLERTTGKAGRAVAIAPRGASAPWLMPEGTAVSVRPLGTAGLRIGSLRALSVGNRVVEVRDSALQIWGPDLVRAGEGLASVDIVAGSDRFVLGRNKEKVSVIDLAAGKVILEAPAKHARLVHQSDGKTRLLSQESAKGGSYQLRDVPSGEVIVSLPANHFPLALDGPTKRFVVFEAFPESRVQILDSSTGEEVGSVRTAKGQLFVGADISRDGTKLVAWRMDSGGYAYQLIDIGSGAARPVGRSSVLQQPGAVFTSDAKHVCITPPAAPAPSAGATTRCHRHTAADGHADGILATRPQSPPGYRPLAPELELGIDSTEVLSPDGQHLASIERPATPFGPGQVVSMFILVSSVKTGRLETWSEANVALWQRPNLSFSEDGSFLTIGDIAEYDLTRIINPDVSKASSSLPKQHQTNTVRVDKHGAVIIKTKSGIEGKLVRVGGGRAAGFFENGGYDPAEALPEDMACAFGEVLAPIEVCSDRFQVEKGRLAKLVAGGE